MKRWLITGASRGLGRAFAEAALERGDKVAVTSRKLRSLDFYKEKYGENALAIQLELKSQESIQNAVLQAVSAFGGLDVLVNNAGYIQLGAMEETTEAEARQEMETLFWGPYFMTKAVLPYFRAQKSGMFVQVSSLAGIGGLPGNTIYAAAKYALEGMSEALMREVAYFGIKVLILEPAGIQTDIASGVRLSEPIPDYTPVTGGQRARWAKGGDSKARGNARICARRLLELVDMDKPPLRFLMSAFASEMGIRIHSERLEEAKQWADKSRSITPEQEAGDD